MLIIIKKNKVMTNTKNLYTKIQEVSKCVKTINKDLVVGKGYNAYKAVSDTSVTLKIKAAEERYGILSIAYKQELVHQEVIKSLSSDNKESLMFSFIIKMTTRIIDLDNPSSYVDVESYGHGIDRGDKGFGKASTYARKYGLLNAYKIATGEDPDNDPSKTLESERKQPLRDYVINYMEQHNKYKIEVFTHYGVSDYSQLTDSQLKSIEKSIIKRTNEL